jgi:orotate phosphoribosyltransferase
MDPRIFDAADRDALLRRLQRDALIEGEEFELSSGGTSTVYVDVRRVSLQALGADLIGRGLWALGSEVEPEVGAFGGLTLGADPLVTSAALASHADHTRATTADSIIVRKATKEHGTGERVEAPAELSRDRPVIAVDDTMTTGNSTLEAVEQLRADGWTVRHALAVVDREAGARETLDAADVELHSLYTLDGLVA